MKIVRRIVASVATCLIVVLVGSGILLWVSGWRMFIVHTGSMTPNIPSGDLVIDRPASSVRTGEVITFAKAPGQYTTHRVAAITSHGIETRGDANPSNDFGYVTRPEIAGRVVAAIPYAGFVAAFLTHPTGVAGLILFMVSIWLAWDLLLGTDAEHSPVSTVRSNIARIAAALEMDPTDLIPRSGPD